MTTTRRAWGQVAILALSLIGVAISIYLTFVHYQDAPLVCNTGGIIDCELILTSRYALVPGTEIPVSLAGLLWCGVSAALAFVLWRLRPEERRLRFAQLGWSIAGILTVFYLVYVEIVLVGKICAWCTVVHIATLAILLLAVWDFQQSSSEEEYEDSEEVEQTTVSAGRE